MNSLPEDLRKSYLGIAFTVLWPSLWSFPGICAMIVFTAGSLKVFFSLKMPLFDHQILSANGSNQNFVIYLFMVLRLRLECHHCR